MKATCPHIVGVEGFGPAADGCETCLEVGGTWVHLRQCLACGRTGCCDSSPNRHASAHVAATGHKVVRSLEPGEDWSWCYQDQVGLVLDRPAGSTRIPPSPLL